MVGTGNEGTSISVTIPEKSTGNRSYKANWIPNIYTVRYHPNGGSGTMTDSSHIYDMEGSLSDQFFTRTGYSFEGWATTPSGDVVYLNKQKIKNLAESGVVNSVRQVDGNGLFHDL